MIGYFQERLKELLSLSPKVRGLFIGGLVPIGIYEAVKILPPLLFKELIDKLVYYAPGSSISLELVLVLLAGYLMSLLSMSIIEYFAYVRNDLLIRDIEIDVAKRTLTKLLALDITYHEQRDTGASMNKLLKGQSRLNDLLWSLTGEVVPVMFQTIFTLAVLFWVGAEIGIAFLCFIPIFILIISRGAQATQKSREEYHYHHDQFASVATQSVANIRTVKDFANERAEFEKSGRELEKFGRAVDERTRKGRRNMLTQGIVVGVARITTLGLAVLLMVKGLITAGSLVLVLTLSEKAYSNLARLYRTYYRMQDAEPSITRFRDIADAKVKVRDDAHAHASVRKGAIAFSRVSFSYEGTKANALTDVSFEIEPKTTLALVGKSGSGKSTLVKLLFRHADPDAGVVSIDGSSLRQFRLADLRAAMAIVSQDVELFNESVLENIAYGIPKATREQVVHAARLANAHEFIERLPNGYDTFVGERGVRLSGGQKQRLAIARALIKQPKILVFDEATSSLDAESEREIHESIFRLHGKLTLIIIAHRFSTIEHAQNIVVLEDGKVAEVGTHAELVEQKGIFARLRKLQELGEVKE